MRHEIIKKCKTCKYTIKSKNDDDMSKIILDKLNGICPFCGGKLN